LLYVARDTRAGRIAVVRGEELVAADWKPFVSSLLIAGLGGALVASLLSVFLARRLSRPLRQLARATTELASGDRAVRVEVPGNDEIARLAAAFNRMTDELEASEEAEREFLMSVSHELKTPLTAIAGYAEAIAEGAVDADEGCAVIRTEAARLHRLVSDLLDLARLDRKAFSIDRTPVDAAEVAEWAHDRAAQRARELGVVLELDPAAASWVLADPDRLLQAVSNLVENALRCAPAGGRVTIKAGQGTLTVQDTGPGLAEDDLPRAFDSFYLQTRYRSDRPVGSGLGLAIVKQLVVAMGGSVSVASRPGQGATFTIRLQPTDPPRRPAATLAGSGRSS
jgi:two-component system sensor histidine kinase BaeS